jgi:hypothetical protein
MGEAVGGDFDGVASGDAARVGVAVARGDGVGSGDCVALDVALDVALGCDVASGASVGTSVGVGSGDADGEGDASTATCVDVVPCLPASESPAPITKPSTITPIMNGISGKLALLRLFGGRRDRRGGVSSIAGAFGSRVSRPCAVR